MSRRLNVYGFSLARMRQLIGSGNETTLIRVQEELNDDPHFWSPVQQDEVNDILEHAIMIGTPIPDLEVESSLHAIAASALASHDQEHLMLATAYPADALDDGLWGQYRKHASPEARAFLRGLVEGIPLFGQQPATDGSTYAAVALDRLRGAQRGLRDLADLIAYRIERKRWASDEDHSRSAFAAELCDWVDQLVTAERDLWFVFG
jgi:hypothetical protein